METDLKDKQAHEILRDERGAGLVEYIILAGVVALLSIFAFTEFGDAVRNKVDDERGRVADGIVIE